MATATLFNYELEEGQRFIDAPRRVVDRDFPVFLRCSDRRRCERLKKI